MELKFNIVYTLGTVEHLRLFVFSLLKWSDCSFRLVANACSPEEVQLLQKLCLKSPRLEFLALPSKTNMRHGEALSYLQSVERSEHFSFMDSDILATDDFMSEMSPYLHQYAGVFSGTQIWCTEEEQIVPESFPNIPGHFNRTDKGVCLGSTYFAIYDNRILTQFVQSTGVTFRKYRWSDIAPLYQRQLVWMGLKKRGYDTGKLVNVLLPVLGKPLVFVDSPSLQHLGSVSAYVTLKSGLHPKENAKSVPWLRAAKKIKRWIKRSTGIKGPVNQKMPLTETQRMVVRAKRRKKIMTGVYFTRFLRCLFENQRLPEIPNIGDPEIERRIESVSENIVALYEEFGEQLT